MDNKPTLHILLADDQANVRSALRLLLEQEPGIAIAGEAADATGLLLMVTERPASILLLDWELPGLPSRYLLRLLLNERPSLRVIAMSSRPEAHRAALQAGASAFLNKGDPPEAVLDALAHLPGDEGAR